MSTRKLRDALPPSLSPADHVPPVFMGNLMMKRVGGDFLDACRSNGQFHRFVVGLHGLRPHLICFASVCHTPLERRIHSFGRYSPTRADNIGPQRAWPSARAVATHEDAAAEMEQPRGTTPHERLLWGEVWMSRTKPAPPAEGKNVLDIPLYRTKPLHVLTAGQRALSRFFTAEPNL